MPIPSAQFFRKLLTAQYSESEQVWHPHLPRHHRRWGVDGADCRQTRGSWRCLRYIPVIYCLPVHQPELALSHQASYSHLSPVAYREHAHNARRPFYHYTASQIHNILALDLTHIQTRLVKENLVRLTLRHLHQTQQQKGKLTTRTTITAAVVHNTTVRDKIRTMRELFSILNAIPPE